METININEDNDTITDNEIKKFLNTPENVIKYNLRFFEALFIRYLKQYEFITVEAVDILLSRQKLTRDKKREILSSYKDFGLPTFEEEIRKRTPNLGVISHILIPELTINNIYTFDKIDMKKLVKSTRYYEKIADNMRHIGAFEKKVYEGCLKEAINNYNVAGFIEYKDRNTPIIKMSEYQATNEIKRYRKAYGNYSVGDLDYYVKEKMVKKV